MGNPEQGIVFVFTGTSGSGRKTIAERIGRELGIRPLISYTTREKRPKESDGRQYHFITRQEFIEADIRSEFFQTVEIDNCFYGIKKSDIAIATENHANVYVVVNRYGANRFKYEYADKAVRIFIYVNKQTIRERLQARDVSEEILTHYMDHYSEEVSYRKDCEHVFENMELTETIEHVKKAISPYLTAVK